MDRENELLQVVQKNCVLLIEFSVFCNLSLANIDRKNWRQGRYIYFVRKFDDLLQPTVDEGWVVVS